MTKVKYLKLEISFDSRQDFVRVRRPKTIGTESHSIPLSEIAVTHYSLGALMLFGAGIVLDNGKTFWVPAAGRLNEKRSKMIVEEIARAAGLQSVSKPGFGLYFCRPEL